MTSQMMVSNHDNAVVEIVTGKMAIKKKMSDIAKNAKLPLGLMPVDDVEELEYNPATGFFRATRKIKLDHFFKKINRKTSFDTEVTCIFKEHRMTKITGVKSKEMMIWVSINDISIDKPESGKIIFKATAGVTRTFLVSDFEEDEPAAADQAEEKPAVKATEVEVKEVEATSTKPAVGVEKNLEESKTEVEVKN